MNAALEHVLVGSSRAPSRVRFGGIVLVALASHLGVGVAAASIPHAAHPPSRQTEIQALPEEPPPPPPPESPPPAPEPPPAAAPPVAAAPPPAAPPPPAAAPLPAAAANVMTAPADAPVDMTGGMVVGSAETYGGGAVSATGTSTGVGARGSAPNGTTRVASPPPPPPVPKGPDRSRPPRLAEGVSWSCPFPPEADEKGIDDAVVGLAIEVGESGALVNVTVERDPGNGFGRVAASCARSKRFSPAEDHDGKPVAGRSRVNVRFHR